MQGHGQAGRKETNRRTVRQSVAPSDGRRTHRGPTGPEVYARPPMAAGAQPTRKAAPERARNAVARVTPEAAPPTATGRLSIWSALLPSACLLCAAVQRDVVCAACAGALRHPAPRCPRCALPGGGHCGVCADDDPIDATLTLGDYADPFDALVQRLKFGAKLPAAHWIAAQLAGCVQASGAAPDLIVPIPLSPARLAERGFNQAWEIARPLARQLGVAAMATALVRHRHTASQREFDLDARRANVQGAFAVHPTASLVGRHVGLVDDVMTTGATLREAARVLKAHGVARVTALPALRTP